MIKVSIVVVTYNSDWEKLRLTINSILIQKNINYEIIFCDDGSKVKHNEKICEYLKNKCIYHFSDSNKNVGTVKNILNGVKKSVGKYIKVISPGDCFYDEFSLCEWTMNAENNNTILSFCNSIYYKNVGEKFEILYTNSSPRNIYLYDKGNDDKIFVDYLLANDSILGASVLVKKDVFIEYLIEISDKVIYAEDYAIRIMLYDGIKINRFNRTCLWYEYGEGISTANNKKWNVLLKNDFNEANNLILDREPLNRKINKKYRYLLIKYKKNHPFYKILKVLLFPSVIIYRINMKWNYNLTSYGDLNNIVSIKKYIPKFNESEI